MSNLTDALIAAKLVGGSGGSGGGSGLPEITTETTTIFAEQSVAFVDQEGTYGTDALNIVFVLGETYTVAWDGTDYTCTAFDDGDGGVAVGNLSIWGTGDDTGEPFVISYYSGDAAYAGTLSTAASHTIKIGQITSQSPADGSIMQVVNGAWTAVKPMVTITEDTNASTYACDKTYAEISAAMNSGYPVQAEVIRDGVSVARALPSYEQGAAINFFVLFPDTSSLHITCYNLFSNDVMARRRATLPVSWQS